MLIHGIEIRPDGHGECGILSNHTDRSDPAELPSSVFPRPRSDRAHNPASNSWR